MLHLVKVLTIVLFSLQCNVYRSLCTCQYLTKLCISV